MKRVLAVILAVLMAFSLAACNKKPDDGKKETDASGREHVKIVWYLHAVNVGPGLDQMQEAVNNYLKDKLNTEIEFHYYRQAEFKETINTVFNAGTYMDIVTIGNTGLNFDSNVTRNAFLDVTDLLPKYCPETLKMLPDGALEAYSYQGKVYGMPPVKDLASWQMVQVNMDMLKDLGLEFPEHWNSYWDLLPLLYKVKEARDAKYPDQAKNPVIDVLDDNRVKKFYLVDAITGNYSTPYLCTTIKGVPDECQIKNIKDDFTVFNFLETPEALNWAKTIHQLVADGIYPFDFDTYDSDKYLTYNGAHLWDANEGALFTPEDTYNFDAQISMSDLSIATRSYMMAGGMAITAQSKYPDRALEVLELMNTDQYFATLVRFGPENVGWTDKDNDNIIELTDANSDASARLWYCWYGWITGGLATSKTPSGYPGAEFGKKLLARNQGAIGSSHMGFAFDSTNVQNELAACNAIYESCYQTLLLGQEEDVEAIIAETNKKLYDSGLQKLIDEAQKQMDAYRASTGK
ncbi:MAG: ABC transporter substrate-binding protein [Lachnospiraceae bacterium]|nr:ABC transporter substrate-binding protein [Lachnospiraceae bacterium]